MEKLTFAANEIKGTLAEAIECGGYIPVCVSGYSMRPLLRHLKDTVWIKKCPANELERGRILLYQRNDGRIFLHRILKIEKSGLMLMNGDSHTECEYIAASQVLGAVYEIERNGKKLPYDSFGLKCYEKIWTFFKPFRPVLLRILRLFGV